MSTDDLIHCARTRVALPLTAAQRGIYYAQQIDPHVPMSVAAFVEFHGDVDADRLNRAVADAAEETESGLLRLVPNDEDEPTALVDADRRIELGRRDFSHHDDPAAAARRWMDEHRAHVPDLFSDPLLQTYLLTLGPNHSIWYCWGHHLAFDGYAAMYMMLRVAQRYTAATGAELPQTDIASMASIAEFDADYRSSTRFVDDHEYWSAHLGSDPNALPATSFATRADAAAPLTSLASAALNDRLVEQIRTRAATLEVRPASVITAAVALYLARFNDSPDAMLSLPVAARDTAALRTSAGLTSNVLPILAAIGPADDPRRVDDLICAVNHDIKSAVRHQHYRHEDLTSQVLGAANGRRGFFGPMVNVMLFFKHIDFGSLPGALTILSTGPVEDASVNVYDALAGGMSLDLEANPNVYSDAEVRTHHRRLVEFLDRFVSAAPDLPVTELPIATESEAADAERQAVGPTVDYGEQTLTCLLDAAYRRFADRTALIDPDGTSLTYDELHGRARAVAAALCERGIGPESVVGVRVPRGIDQHVVLHAIAAVGAVFVPLTPDEPVARLRRILDVAEPELIVGDDDLDPAGTGRRAPVAALADLEAHGATVPDPAPLRAPHPDSGAYLLFTSGSTGAPKGVLVSHRALVNRLRWMQDAYPLDSDDRVLHKTPAGFDVSVWEYFWPTTVGAAAVVAAPDGHRDPWYLQRIIEQTRVTTLHFVPSMLAVFAESLNPGSAADAAATRTALSSVRTIFTSGEALTPGIVAATASVTATPIHNLYGPTEAAVDVTHHDACDPTEPVVPIGMPIHNTVAHVLDRRLAPRPAGAVGELYLGGVQLARGYLGRPDLTADRFIADPFGSGGRLYRTGDLVRRRADGELEYLGRSDSQVKIRGQRVELGEVEAALAALPEVRTAGVTVRDDLLDDRVIIGYVTGDGLSDRDMRAELATAVPPHMIPTAVVVCESLPTTANGKLDRRALPAPDLGDVGPRATAEPVTELDRLVRDTVGAVLDLPEPSMSAGFFAIGGNSLSATRVAARLSTATGVRLGIRDVFDAPDLAGIATALRGLGVPADIVPQHRRSRHAAITGPVPLSPAQHRIWLTSRLDPTLAATYNIPFAIRLTGALDRDALVAALNDVVARHEPLRTTVDESDGIAYQRVLPAHDGILDVECLPAEKAAAGATPAPGPAGGDTAAEATTPAEEFAARPFDLAADLPIRARLVSHRERDHTLAVVIHHLAADGWSLAPFADDLARAYRARTSGAGPAWPDLPVTYRQASADRLAWLEDPSSDAGDQLAYWSAALEHAPVESGLPYDRPPTRGGARTGDHVRVPIEAATRTRLFSLADRLDVTPFMVIHAAVAALLRTASDTDDIVVGTPVSGRGSGDLDALVGMFVNTLALRTRVDKEAAFGDLLAAVRECDLTAFDNADIPFDRLVTELNPDRSTGGQPYFDVSVALEDTAEVVLDFEGLSATASRIDTGTSKFGLEFTVTDRHGDAGMELLLGYADDLFDRITATGLASRFVRLLDTVTDDPNIAVGDACVLDPVDRLDLVPAVGGGTRPAEHLSQLIATAAAAAAHHPAIVDAESNRTLTYRDLDVESNRLARTLMAAGAGPEDFVAIALPRGTDWLVALFAVAKSGAAWVPVDPAHPRTRIEFMLADSGAEVVLTDRASAAELPTGDPHTVLLVDDLDTAGDQSITAGERLAPIDIDQPAYLIYTSGTTGRPKGVVVSHRGLADLAAEQVSALTMNGSSRTLHLASPSFDASILEVIMAVGATATMHIAPAGMVGGRELAELMADAAITHAFLTPSLLTTMSPDDLPQLESLVIGGESPNSEAVRRWAVGRRVINAYGPTETTVVATMSRPIAPNDAVTIGRPIRGVSAMVLDERLRPVPPGTIGELYLCGSHLARGYHRVPSLTSKHFIANPLSHDGERMYRTGDLVRWTADRSLEFRGRSDHQTKVRGHRIELGEVDAALVADHAVREAVTVVSGAGETARLVAYVVAAAGSLDPSACRAVRDRLADRLPRHLVPSVVVPLDAIPVTPVGKTDTRALPAPGAPDDTPADEPPRTAAEDVTARAVAQILGIDPAAIGRADDFFELGGNSLLATRLATALEERTASRVAVRALFDDPRLCAIARLVEGDTPGCDTPDGAAEDPRPRLELTGGDTDAPVEPGPAQQQLWFLNRLADPDAGAAYHIAFALDLDGALDVAALQGALAHVVARHEPLRTRYPERDGRPELEVLPIDDVWLGLTPTAVADDEWESRAAAFAAQPFDLTVDCPLRAALHRLPDGPTGSLRHRLSLVIHHIAADGASMAPLARDLGEAYAALHAGRTPHRPEPSITYRDFLRGQTAELDQPSSATASTTRLDALTAWWRRRLDGIDHVPVLASDLEAPSATGRAGMVEVPFPATLRTALAADAAPGTTEFMTMHAVLATLLHHLSADPAVHVETGVSDLVVGTPVAGRSEPALADLVGMFVNSVPLRTRVDSALGFTDLLSQVRDNDLDDLAHSALPFEKLVAELRPPRTGRHPVFGVALTVDDLPRDALDRDLAAQTGLAVAVREIGTGGARFDLELSIRADTARFTFDVGLYSEARIADIAHRFVDLARQLADHPHRPIGDLEPMGPADDRISATETGPAPAHLADLIDRAVRSHPDTVALDDGATRLTYREAGRTANRWARTLTAHGVEPGDVVAVAIDRSAESVLATWAVTTTGATVMPVDARHPAHRVAHMIADSGAVLGITSSALRPTLPDRLTWLTVDDLTADRPGARRALRTPPARRIDSGAYLIYTSGTTGMPKGVVVSHRGLAPFAATQTRRFGVDHTSRTLHFASPGFDAAMLELLLAVDAAATITIAPPTLYGGDELTEFLAEQRVTHAFVTPAALSAAGPRDLPDLRCLGVGGESFGRDLVARWGADRTLLNCYGPTETTIVALMSSLHPGEPITIGRPVAGVSAMVLDHRLRPLPPFAPGELYLTGPGLATGYLNRSAQTARTFVAATDGSGARMYRTGDLAATDLAGNLVFHGRSDHQVKVRGFRIELDEVDAVLTGHPDVGASVTVVDGSGDSARLVSYVTGAADADVDRVRSYAGDQLPRHMVPAVVVPLDTIPLTVNGKVDRAALAVPERAERVPARRPAPGAETLLADLVGDVLGLPAGSVGADDDFFALGGTSLQATTVVSRINAVHRGDPIRVRMVFDHPSVAALARLLDVDPTRVANEPVPSASDVTRFPLAPMQKRLWSLHRSDPASVDYAMPFVLRLHGSLDATALREALVDVVARHAVLRTVYTDTDNGPVGVVRDDPEAVVGDLANSDEDAAAMLRRPFDLTRDAPIRALLTGRDDSHELLLVLHHIAADGASMQTVIGDLLGAYRARTGATDQQVTRAPAVPDYRDHALTAQRVQTDADLQYWTAVLDGAPAVTSVDADPAQADRTGGATVDLPIELPLRDEIVAFARANSTSAFTVLHTALAVLLNRLGAGDDLVIGTPVDTRAAVGGHHDFRETVGMFVNTVALRSTIDGSASAQSLVEQTRDADLDAWDHLTAPFDDIVSALNPPRLSGRSPLFQVALSVHDFADSISGEHLPVSADLIGEIAELDTQAAKFDLQFTVTGMNSSSTTPNLSLTYARNRYDDDQAAELSGRLLRVVRALVADPQRRVGDIRITDPLEADALTPVSGPAATAPRTFAELLDDAVRRNPDGIAVTTEQPGDGTADITYRELFHRANRLARWLLQQGVAQRPESVVAVAIPRSAEAITAIWAVVRTGAAYVPVDPTYPADRIAHMLDDAGVDLIVTTGAHADALPDSAVPTVLLDDPTVQTQLAQTCHRPIRADELPRPIDLDQLAYVIYTSGSTGTPKGVQATHRGLAAVHDELGVRMSPDTDSRVLHFASPSFDASILEFLMAAAGAATLVVAPTTVYGGGDLQDFLARRTVTHAFITPAAVATMVPGALPSLTALAVGGEAVPADLIRAWSTDRTLINVYGPTETTVITTGSAPLAPDGPVTIGRPNNGVAALVLDRRLHPVPPGVTGELYLLGPQVTRGYRNRPSLTSTRYPAAPMALGDEFAGQRMYRTGDLVRWRTDRADDTRSLEYVGRADGQVQVRGFRVELREIDDALTAEADVRAAVTVADSTSGHTVLHSYVALEHRTSDGGAVDPATLRRAVARRLPRHLVPTTVTVLDRLPLTAVGKVDRAALPAPQLPTRQVGDAPAGATEQRIAEAFATVLRVDGVGRDDNFFDVGGDSLHATALADELRRAGYQVTVPDVFAAPTPAELAAAVGADGGASALAPVLTLRRPTGDSDAAPLFAIHPAIGLAWSFTSLLPHVDDARAVYGLQNPALSGDEPATSIADLAADYVRRIREQVPHGPYRLLGWSLGGLIAHEVAVALQELGEDVEQLTILDSYILAQHPEMARGESLLDLLGEFGIDTAELTEAPDEDAIADAVRAGGGPLAALSADQLSAIRTTFEGAGELANRWRPRVFDGDAVFVTATRADHDVCARADWIDRVTGDLIDVRVDCTHARMLLPENVAQYRQVVGPDPDAMLHPHRTTPQKESR